ncbi:sialidase-4 isoform X1 [Python bivittatus]|uniref:exo-alpha-sialidase n=2 Tax=Python bivittatus TaxID=176946 RepID=A0A9F3QUQ7_PYTBI|nr:sialidase-4 isoform X1 [Python bivittatus]XP_025029040.1 sialidase-4 isoform X1 [Python bivittatus]
MGSRHFPARTVLFERETSGVTYRVPALLYIPSVAKLLAFAEERLSVDDADANLLVLRRGTFYKDMVQWEDMQAIETAALIHHRSMNPCPIYDEFTGMVFLFFIAVLGRTSEAFQIVTGQNAARLCYVSSSDQGISWSHVTDLTEEVIGTSIQDWATFALGPGHGIQLKSGRLLLPAYMYYIDCKTCFGKLCKTTPHAFAFYSDDHGHSWCFGEFIPNLQTIECQMVSVDEEDGSHVLFCNARSPLGFRVQALSADDGAIFHSGQLVPRLVEPPHGCHGSIIGFPAPLYSMYHGIQGSQRKACPVKEQGFLLESGMRERPLGCPAQLTTSLCNQYLCHQHLERFISTGTSSAYLSSVLSPTSWNMACTNQDHNNAGTVSKSDPYFEIPTWVLYSHPTSSRSRDNLGVHLSTFPRDVDSWSEPWVIYEGPSAYSDLAYIELPYSEFPATGIPAIAFACLYENGVQSPYEQISFSMFTLHEVLQNIPLTTSSLSQKQSSEGRKRKGTKCDIS